MPIEHWDMEMESGESDKSIDTRFSYKINSLMKTCRSKIIQEIALRLYFITGNSIERPVGLIPVT